MIQKSEDFYSLIETIEAEPGYQRPLAFALGVRRSKNDKVLDVLYLAPNYQARFGSAAILHNVLKNTFENGFVSIDLKTLSHLSTFFTPFFNDLGNHPTAKVLLDLLKTPVSEDTYFKTDFGVYFLFDGAQKVTSAEEAYFKLQLLSHRFVKPHDLCLDGAFGALTNVAWTNYGPILPEDVATERLKYVATNQPLQVSHVDKFPYLLNYHIPSGVRVASGSQVRLGAHLGEGTTVMPSGFVNFNAGTLGTAMIEGRVSAGVVVGENSDIGGGASIMGTLSGGNKDVISIGSQSLLGANAGAGISLGNGCTVAAGLYIYAGMKISLYNAKNEPIDLQGRGVKEGDNIVKAKDLSGRDFLLFIQDSQTGKVICKPNQKAIELNSQLHSNT